jgi:anti-sigma B factor antagonist
VSRLTVDARGQAVIAHVEGEVDSVTAGELRDGLSRRLTNVGPGLILDLSGSTYLDSAGIEFLFDLARRLRTRGQRLRLVVPAKAPMRRVLDLCGVDEVARMDTTLDAAVDGLYEPAP